MSSPIPSAPRFVLVPVSRVLIRGESTAKGAPYGNRAMAGTYQEACRRETAGSGGKQPLVDHRPPSDNPRVDPLTDLLGHAPGIVGLREQIRQVLARTSRARRLPPILLEGETGTGKNLVA